MTGASDLKSELIEDREIAALDEDRLGHEGIASELADLALKVPTGSNIALFGAWGSGKSGIGNLLEQKVDDGKSIRFVRFDAFKYAENPLRRNFISVVADGLNVRDSRYREGLYSGRTTTDFKVPARKVAALLGLFAAVSAVALLVTLAVIIAIAAVQGGDWWELVVQATTSSVPSVLVPASLVTALIALIGRTFVVERREEKTDSDEEFERLLTEIVSKSRAERVIVFVDELDRCAADDVVETLNAVRTFLGVPKCVFVVAADQQVLEQALSRSLTQETPVDALNPYYSAGSAYLDKVFQYQVVVPPLMPQSVTSFAVELMKERAGVWREVDPYVVASILVPSHVRSPRRVKNLMNSYVLAYRLAKSRQTSGQLDVVIDKHLDELARVVCLRVEFPLFSRDLTSDPSLSEHVRALADRSVEERNQYWLDHPYVAERIRTVAEGYAGKSRPVDTVLAEEVGSVTPGATSTQIDEVRDRHGQQLLDYLSRTRHVTGPTKALIFLQTSGNVFGLPGTVAADIEAYAQNASMTLLRSRVDALPPTQQSSVLDLLIQQARSAVGVESENVVSSILALIASGVTLNENADNVCVVVAETVTRRPEVLRMDTAPGAWELAVASSRPEADQLGRAVLSLPEIEEENDLLIAVCRHADEAFRLDATRMAATYSDLVLRPEDFGAVMKAISKASRLAVVRGSRAAISTSLTAQVKAFEDRPASATTSARGAAGTVVETAHDPEESIVALGDLLRDSIGEDALAGEVILLLSSLDNLKARDQIESVLDRVKVQSVELSAAVIRSGSHRVCNLWGRWLAPLDSALVAGSELLRLLVVELAGILVVRAQSEKTPTEDIQRAAGALARLLEHAEPEFADRVGRAAVKVRSIDITDDDTIDDVKKHLDTAGVLVDSGLATPTSLVAARWRVLVDVLTTEQPNSPEPVESALSEYVIESVRVLASADEVQPDQLNDLAEALARSDWMNEFDLARAGAALHGTTSDASRAPLPLIDCETLGSYRVDLSGEAFEQLQIDWFRATTASVLEVQEMLSHAPQPASDAVLAAMRIWAMRLSREELVALAIGVVGGPGSPLPSRSVLASVGWDLVDQRDARDLLVARYEAETHNQGRSVVLSLWERASIESADVRRELLQAIAIPMLGLNAQAADLMIGKLTKLAAPVPDGVKKALGNAVQSAVDANTSLSQKTEGAMKKLGYGYSKRGLFWAKRRVDPH